MAKSFCSLTYHIIFSTKDREPWLTAEIRPRVHAFIGGLVKREGGVPVMIGGVADHMHILAELRQDKAVSDAICAIKAISSGWVRDNMSRCGGFGWQTGYGAFSVSQSNVAKVSDYIVRQEEHHRRIGFQEEYLKFLRAHGVACDDVGLWR